MQVNNVKSKVKNIFFETMRNCSIIVYEASSHQYCLNEKLTYTLHITNSHLPYLLIIPYNRQIIMFTG